MQCIGRAFFTPKKANATLFKQRMPLACCLFNCNAPIVLVGCAGGKREKILLLFKLCDLILLGGQAAPRLDANKGRIGFGGMPKSHIGHLGEFYLYAVLAAHLFQGHFPGYIRQTASSSKSAWERGRNWSSAKGKSEVVPVIKHFSVKSTRLGLQGVKRSR